MTINRNNYRTKAEAEADARECLQQFPKGWKIRVWENLGWHWEIRSKRISLHPSHGTFTVYLLAEEGSAGQPASWGRVPSQADPFKAVRMAVAEMERIVNEDLAHLQIIKEQAATLPQPKRRRK